ncbi:MAG TPA: FtsX-like permease family protein, partial [Stellaceae bacterium]|nr:FtsX-like permease family protein [Stellaceae bacterium]
DLGVGVGDEVTVTSPSGTATAFGTMPRIKTYRVAATFEFGMYQYDSAYIFTTLGAAQLFFRQGERATQLEITLADSDDIAGPADKVADTLGPEVRLIGWKRQVGGYVEMVETQRSVMFLILALIIVVAAFNVISSMIMLVKDKGRDIAILRTMGATQGMVLRIFFMAGGSVGTFGTVLGFALGVLVCENIERIRELLQRLTGTDPFNAKMYFLDHIPARLDPMEVAEVVVMAMGLSFLATIYPAWRAARLDPVEALRYE